jgi:hypothetical protein
MAQSISCTDFSVLEIGPNQFDSTVYDVSIQFSAPSTMHVNYPYVSAVLNCNGDTVATGGMSSFAHLGQTTNDYMVTLSGSLTCEPLTVVFVYGNDSFDVDTCILSYGNTAGLSNTSETADAFSLFPNPVKSQVNIQTGISQLGTDYFVYDQTGKLMLTGRVDSENTLVDMSKLSQGIYFFRVGLDLKQMFKAVKE